MNTAIQTLDEKLSALEAEAAQHIDAANRVATQAAEVRAARTILLHEITRARVAQAAQRGVTIGIGIGIIPE